MQPHVPEQLRRRVFRGSHAVRTGVLTPRQLRSSAWQRLFPDVYVHAAAEVTHALRSRAAAGVLLPGSVVSGRSAAVLWGIDLAGAEDDVDIVRPPGSHPVRVPGLRVRRARLEEDDVCSRAGVRVLTPEATAASIAATLPPVEAVVALDRLVVSGLVELHAVRTAARRLTGAGSRRARVAAARADGLAESPQETRLRLVLHDSPLPRPVAQHRVRHGGRQVAKVDFAWPEHRVAVEYDGLWHAEPGQFGKDRARLNRLTAAGWRVVFVTAADLYHPEQLLARVAAALAA